MGFTVIHELHNCLGKPPASSGQVDPSEQAQVPDDEAGSYDFIPAEGLCTALISPHRVIVTGGVMEDERVLPFTVIRYLDLDHNAENGCTWAKAVHLRSSGRKRRGNARDSSFPVCRMEQTMVFVPDTGLLYLIGGLKVGGREGGNPCRTIFSFDPKRLSWQLVEDSGRVKAAPDDQLGPRFTHSACYIPLWPGLVRSRSRSSGFIVAFGGYSSVHDRCPRSDVHVFDVKQGRWTLCRPKGGITPPALAYHAAAIVPGDRFLAVHGGCQGDFNDTCDLSDQLYVFDVHTNEWIKPNLHPSSVPPPTARKRHCMVRGVGKHNGALVIFGGNLDSGDYCSDFFVFRILMGDGLAVVMSVIWEKVELRCPALRPLLVVGDNLSSSSDRFAASGASLVPIPAVGKYLLLGGRGPRGVHRCPKLLEPVDAPDFGVSDSILADDIMNGAKVTTEAIVEDSRESLAVASIPTDRDDDCRQDDAGELHGAHGPQRANIASLQFPSIDKSPSPAPGDKEHEPSRAAYLSQNEFVRNEDERLIIPDQLSGPSAGAVDDEELRIDVDRAIAHFRGENNSASNDEPAPKRRCTVQSRKEIATPEADLVDLSSDLSRDANLQNSSRPVIIDSVGSDFVEAAELGRRGRNRGVRGTRGRGRGRGRGRVAARAKKDLTPEKDSEADGSRLSTEILEKQEVILRSLREEVIDLKKEKEGLVSENCDLNNQVKQYVEQIKQLQSSADKPTPFDRIDGSPTSPDGRIALPKEASITPTSVTRAEQMNALRAKAAELKMQLEEVTAEKDNSNKIIREFEDLNSELQAQVVEAKSNLSKACGERDTFRKQAEEACKSEKTATDAEEKARRQLRKVDEERLMLKHDLEGKLQEMQHLKHQRAEENLELTNAGQLVKSVRGKLAEATKKHESFDALQRQLECSLAEAKEQNIELRKELEGRTSALRDVEERNIELVAECDRVKGELESRVRECSVAMKEADSLRNALEVEKKHLASLTIDCSRVNRELEWVKQRKTAIWTKLERNRTVISNLVLTLSNVTKDFGPVLNDISVEDDVYCAQMQRDDDIAPEEKAASSENAQNASHCPRETHRSTCDNGFAKDVALSGTELRDEAERNISHVEVRTDGVTKTDSKCSSDMNEKGRDSEDERTGDENDCRKKNGVGSISLQDEDENCESMNCSNDVNIS